ncbi:hypothetical protein PR048_021057 [Dryococelus australis]|uniref:Uncharacterized protein n=1 Tax=Dryococelus australis TaxID=614101 RepID=A0ABQ9GX63_9NEOP|nr:hypothetical protein PR048_021057 [Dryococelus australis]
MATLFSSLFIHTTQHEKQCMDRHGNHSLNCMVVCGSHQKCSYASAKWQDSVRDSGNIRVIQPEFTGNIFEFYITLHNLALTEEETPNLESKKLKWRQQFG